MPREVDECAEMHCKSMRSFDFAQDDRVLVPTTGPDEGYAEFAMKNSRARSAEDARDFD